MYFESLLCADVANQHHIHLPGSLAGQNPRQGVCLGLCDHYADYLHLRNHAAGNRLQYYLVHGAWIISSKVR